MDELSSKDRSDAVEEIGLAIPNEMQLGDNRFRDGFLLWYIFRCH